MRFLHFSTDIVTVIIAVAGMSVKLGDFIPFFGRTVALEGPIDDVPQKSYEEG